MFPPSRLVDSLGDMERLADDLKNVGGRVPPVRLQVYGDNFINSKLSQRQSGHASDNRAIHEHSPLVLDRGE